VHPRPQLLLWILFLLVQYLCPHSGVALVTWSWWSLNHLCQGSFWPN